MPQTQPLTRSAGKADTVGAIVWSFLHLIWQRYQQWRRCRRTVQTLRSLDERTLKDIGIDASEIESVVYGLSTERKQQYRPYDRSGA
jgi:uncharacterized protein YjiS (DUF1127 family)